MKGVVTVDVLILLWHMVHSKLEDMPAPIELITFYMFVGVTLRVCEVLE